MKANLQTKTPVEIFFNLVIYYLLALGITSVVPGTAGEVTATQLLYAIFCVGEYGFVPRCPAFSALGQVVVMITHAEMSRTIQIVTTVL